MKTKSKTTAIILAFFLGGLGFHKFYLGQIFQGVLYLLFCWTFISLILSIIDIIIYLCMSEEAFQQKYCKTSAPDSQQQMYQQPYQPQAPSMQYNSQGGFVFCSSCGARVEAGTKFCPNCGSQIE